MRHAPKMVRRLTLAGARLILNATPAELEKMRQEFPQ
jgi:hypothetical protein